MSRRALVVGGTGPTGPHVLAGLLQRGFDVTIYHRGAHEPADLPDVRHIHGDPHFPERIEADLGTEEYDAVIAAYGRTRHLAEALAGRCSQFIAIGGMPRYKGFYDPAGVTPEGLPVPVAETAARVPSGIVDAIAPVRFASQMVATEDAVLTAIPEATYLIYPFVYGPRNVVPLEWSVIKRVGDGRQRLLLPDGGHAIVSRGAARNLAEFVLLAVDHPAVVAGEVFNCGDDLQMSLHQWVQLILEALGAEIEIVPVPATVAPLFQAIYLPNSQHLSTHCLLDTSKARVLLGYRDVISPAAALTESVAWYRLNPVDGTTAPPSFVDRFDYELEDGLIRSWIEASTRLRSQYPQHLESEVHPMPHPKQPSGLVDQRGR